MQVFYWLRMNIIYNKRFLKVDFCNDDVEFLNFIKKNNICVNKSNLYQSLCVVYEKKHEFTLANNVFIEGIDTKPENYLILKKDYEDFEKRMQNRILRDIKDSTFKEEDLNLYLDKEIAKFESNGDGTSENIFKSKNYNKDSNDIINKRKHDDILNVNLFESDTFNEKSLKRKKLNFAFEEKLNSYNMTTSANYGSVPIYVDENNRNELIRKGSILVKKYDILFTYLVKHDERFKIKNEAFLSNLKEENLRKPLSWISGLRINRNKLEVLDKEIKEANDLSLLNKKISNDKINVNEITDKMIDEIESKKINIFKDIKIKVEDKINSLIFKSPNNNNNESAHGTPEFTNTKDNYYDNNTISNFIKTEVNKELFFNNNNNNDNNNINLVNYKVNNEDKTNYIKTYKNDYNKDENAEIKQNVKDVFVLENNQNVKNVVLDKKEVRMFLDPEILKMNGKQLTLIQLRAHNYFENLKNELNKNKRRETTVRRYDEDGEAIMDSDIQSESEGEEKQENLNHKQIKVNNCEFVDINKIFDLNKESDLDKLYEKMEKIEKMTERGEISESLKMQACFKLENQIKQCEMKKREIESLLLLKNDTHNIKSENYVNNDINNNKHQESKSKYDLFYKNNDNNNNFNLLFKDDLTGYLEPSDQKLKAKTLNINNNFTKNFETIAADIDKNPFSSSNNLNLFYKSDKANNKNNNNNNNIQNVSRSLDFSNYENNEGSWPSKIETENADKYTSLFLNETNKKLNQRNIALNSSNNNKNNNNRFSFSFDTVTPKKKNDNNNNNINNNYTNHHPLEYNILDKSIPFNDNKGNNYMPIKDLNNHNNNYPNNNNTNINMYYNNNFVKNINKIFLEDDAIPSSITSHKHIESENQNKLNATFFNKQVVKPFNVRKIV